MDFSSIEVIPVSYRRLWIIAITATVFSWLFLYYNPYSTSLVHDSAVLRMSTGWTISDGEKIIGKSSDFRKVGWLKDENQVSLTHALPETSGESLCFTTIGLHGQRVRRRAEHLFLRPFSRRQ